MKKARLILLAVSIVFVFTVSGADAGTKKKCSGEGKKNERPGHERSYKNGPQGAGFFEHMTKKLSLSKEQKAKAGKVKLAYKKAVIRFEADINVAGVELHELLSAGEVDMKKAEQKVKEIYDKKAELKVYRISMMEKIKKILTPKQKESLRDRLFDAYDHEQGVKRREEGQSINK